MLMRQTAAIGRGRHLAYTPPTPEEIQQYKEERYPKWLAEIRESFLTASERLNKKTEALSVELKQFVACVEQRKTPLTDGLAGLRVVRILEAATRSMAERGRVVELETVGATV